MANMNSKISDANKMVVKALSYGAEVVIKEDGVPKKISADPLDQILGGYADQLIEPPLDLTVLSMMEESSSELGQNLDAMEINISGFGGRVAPRPFPKEVLQDHGDDVERERFALTEFIENLNPDESLTGLRRKRRRDIEATGNGYWELVPERGDRNKIAAIYHVESHTVRIAKQDPHFTMVEKNRIDLVTGKIITKSFWKRFRKFVQVRNEKVVFFREYGDPRIMDLRNGDLYDTPEDAAAKNVEEKYWANSLYHKRLYTSRTPYGLPRYKGNLFSIFGSRASEEINYKTFKNNLVPNIIISVSGNAMLTEGTVKRIEAFWNSAVKKNDNYSKLLILEAEPVSEGITNSGTAKIDVKPLKDDQHTDALFQNYDKNNCDKIRRSFSLPGIFVGITDTLNRASAEAAKKLAEEQIFSPERDEEDREINQFLLDMGFRFWCYKSFSPSVTDTKDLVSVLNSTEKTGAITPNLGREVLSEVLNRTRDPYEEGGEVNGNIPFSLTMAEAVKKINESKGALAGNERSGVLAPNQGQLPKPPRDLDTKKEFDTEEELKKLSPEWIDSLDVFLDGHTNWETRLYD